METRAQYIRDHYSLGYDERAGLWVALSQHGGIDAQTGKSWSSRSEISGRDKSDVIRRARAQWGHFNFDSEAEAFGEIFPLQH